VLRTPLPPACAARSPVSGACGSVTLGVLAFFSREIRQPDSSLLQIVRVIGSQIGQFMARKQAEENLLYVATHDALTGLPNRYLLNQRFSHALTHAQRYGNSMAILFLDLDRFKYVNDTRGHPFGDSLLTELASACGAACAIATRSRASAETSCRTDRGSNGPNDVANIAQKMLEVVRKPFDIEAKSAT
jgi:GGDEF domain-containing protein